MPVRPTAFAKKPVLKSIEGHRRRMKLDVQRADTGEYLTFVEGTLFYVSDYRLSNKEIRRMIDRGDF